MQIKFFHDDSTQQSQSLHTIEDNLLEQVKVIIELLDQLNDSLSHLEHVQDTS